MELVVTTITTEFMELVAPKATKLVVLTAPGRRAGTALTAMELVVTTKAMEVVAPKAMKLEVITATGRRTCAPTGRRSVFTIFVMKVILCQ